MTAAGYTTRDAARLLGLSPAQVRSYVRSGFIAPARGRGGAYHLSFQDLVLLRVAKGLMKARISPRRVRRSLHALRRQLSADRPLSEVRIAALGDRIVARDGEATWSPESGQLWIDFEVSELAEKVAPLARRMADQARRARRLDAEEWYEMAFDLENVDPDEARDAYLRAVELDPAYADAHVNLGRLLHEEGDLRGAEARYRRALEARPGDPVAAFNLGVALEDGGRIEEAVGAYERAVGLDPYFADAWYNLARLHEQRGRKGAALRALQNYRRLTRR